ncbi:peroxin-7 [Monoraphidium neglectum]|uniref:Peroxin-7 n=1 Tax=Monoraphidium neglectum TaxID=145388 RepID=A0A0D2M139_9CHLO|nr:peroxin-7 [Monoraphidium neglectum]KIY95151.1 peroxin-7 [Monoraphidium neglectum]|eukprot:XP_013894171.1 peroxin-7 [Monoraphidium neglectum]
MPRFHTTFNGYSVKFSPFVESRLAVATAQNFGIIGNGRLHVLESTPAGLVEAAAFDTADGLYDVVWSEENENILVGACGDGSIKLYDLAAPSQANPLRSLQEHRRECCCVSWNGRQRDLFLSSSWDDTVKLWSTQRPGSLQTFTGHTYCVYHVAWSPHHSDVFLSASGDTSVRLWDLRQPLPTLLLPAHAFEVLSADWCKYNDCIIATGSIDKSIKIWDVRQPQRELATLLGHNYAVRRVVFSPHAESVLASCSYDMTVRLWDWRAGAGIGGGGGGGAQLRAWDHHSEFAVGLDMSLLQEGVIASSGWDEWTNVWHMSGGP